LFGGVALYQTGLDFALEPGDVLIVDGNPRWLSNYPLILRAKMRGIPVVWWGQGWSVGSYGNRAALRQRIMRMMDAVVLYTEKEREDYLSLGFRSDRTFALNNGVDIEAIDAAIRHWDASRLEEFRSLHRLDACSRWCVFIGRLTPKARMDVLIDALAHVSRDIGLLVLGDGPVEAELKSQVQKLGLADRIVWAGSLFEETAIAPWMLSASAFVYPGDAGLSIIHGLAYGLPVILHGDRKQHGPEFAAFEEGRNGVSFERGSRQSLTEAINKLMEDESHRNLMAGNAAHLIRQTFNMNDMTKRFIAMISKLRKDRPAR